MWSNGVWGAGDWVVMSVMMLLFWGLLIAVTVWLIRSFGNGRARTDGARTVSARADEVLGERFARGEIDEDKFIHGRDLLHSAGSR